MLVVRFHRLVLINIELNSREKQNEPDLSSESDDESTAAFFVAGNLVFVIDTFSCSTF
jgi:hypothetical protein